MRPSEGGKGGTGRKVEHIGETLSSLAAKTPSKEELTSTSETDASWAEPSREEKLEILRKQLGVVSLDHTFNNFKRIKGTQKAYEAFWELANGSSWNMLLCVGSVGNGKTFLCEALVISLYKQGKFCRLLPAYRMLRAIKRGMDRNAIESTGQIIDRFSKIERLILDDMGEGDAGTDWAWSIMDEIITYRYHEKLFTVITSNVPLDQIPVRITSRFGDAVQARTVINEGLDFRKQRRA